MTIPDIDDTTIRAISLLCAMMLKPKDEQAAMAIAASFQEFIDPLQCEDGIEIVFTPESKP